MKKLFFTLICMLLAFSGTAQTAQTSRPATTNAPDTSGGFAIAKVADQVYTGVAFTPELSIKDGIKVLVKNIDYTLAYTNNINVGVATVTIMGKGNYQGTTTVTFNITPKSINTVNANPIADQTYRNTAIMPDIALKDGNRPLVKDVDYTLVFTNNVNVGAATVNITGKGNYKDSKTMTFKINAKSFGGTSSGIRPATTSSAASSAANTTKK